MEKVNTQVISNTDIERSTFATIAYYDYFNYPLTAAEIYQYLIKTNTKTTEQKLKPAFFEIQEVLNGSENLKRVIGSKNGFYFLREREEIIASRIRRKKLTDQKFKKAKWVLKFLSYLPFVRLIMMSGTMAIGNPYKESDIDLLVVSKAGRIWSTRAFLTFFALVFGKYRHTEKTENRLCLNHYITDKSLAIDFGNLYKAQEYLNLIPIAGEMKIYDEFFAVNKTWMENYVYPHIYISASESAQEYRENIGVGVFSGGNNRENLRTFPQAKIFLKAKDFFEWLLSGMIGDFLEKFFKKIQIFFIQKNPLSHQPGGRLRYTDDNLVFHPVLVEREIIKEYEGKLAGLDANLS